jgi:hypothetical protein
LDLYLQNSGATYRDIEQRTKIIYDPCDTLWENNKDNIDFIPNGSTDEEVVQARLYFSQLLMSELRLRRLPLHGNLEERWRRLRQYLMVEQQLKLISEAVARGVIGREAALMLIEQAIPYVMHLENWVGEKLITVLLAMGAERFQGKEELKVWAGVW